MAFHVACTYQILTSRYLPCKYLHSLDIITIMDLDDYWSPSKDHPAYQMIINDDLPHKIRENIKKVNYVTTTTPIFAEEIKKLKVKIICQGQRSFKGQTFRKL